MAKKRYKHIYRDSKGRVNKIEYSDYDADSKYKDFRQLYGCIVFFFYCFALCAILDSCRSLLSG